MPASPETTSTPRNAAAGRLRAREPRLPAPVWRALGRLSRRQHLIVSGCLIAFVAWIDLVTGERLSVSVFYVAPIFLLTWFVGRRAGLVGAFLCATLRLALALADGSSFPRLVVLWNTDVELGVFLLGAFAFGALKEALSREQALMRTDQLTGLASRHAFFDRLALEVGRNRRDGSSMILAIVDLDDLRGVNDRHGHEFGDAILRRVATCLSAGIRAEDLVGRIGGDEFALVLPDTDVATAQRLLLALGDRLLEASGGDGVSPSMGAICVGPGEEDVDELLRQAALRMQPVTPGERGAVEVVDRRRIAREAHRLSGE